MIVCLLNPELGARVFGERCLVQSVFVLVSRLLSMGALWFRCC